MLSRVPGAAGSNPGIHAVRETSVYTVSDRELHGHVAPLEANASATETTRCRAFTVESAVRLSKSRRQCVSCHFHGSICDTPFQFQGEVRELSVSQWHLRYPFKFQGEVRELTVSFTLASAVPILSFREKCVSGQFHSGITFREAGEMRELSVLRRNLQSGICSS